MYKKRSGTSGVQGQLYETKLLSLILLRAQHDDSIEEFQLATNMEGAGDFDDICFKAKIKGHEKPLIAFLQVKHKENSNKILTLDGKQLYKYFESYLEIKNNFNPDSRNLIFKNNFHDTDCRFILYTNADGEILQSDENEIQTPIIPHLDRLIKTGEVGARGNYTFENVEFILLAKRFAKFLSSNDKKQQNMMNEKDLIRYHVILAQKVVRVYDGETKGQMKCSFRKDFFSSDENDLKQFRDILYKEILKVQKIDKNEMQNSLSDFLSNPSEATLSHVIERVLIYSKGNLKVIRLNDNNLNERILNIEANAYTVCKATEIAAKRLLESKDFSIPALFGNRDLLIRGNENKIEKRLNYLTTKIFDLITKCKPDNVIVIDDSVDNGLVRANGGLGSAVGNLFVNKFNTNLLKFSNDKLEYNARTLLEKLQSKIPNLYEYSFDVKLNKFPILVLKDEFLQREFSENMIFYSKQAHQSDVEKNIKLELKNLTHVSKPILSFKPDAVFLEYHDRVQKWWMSSKESMPFLTKAINIHQPTDLVSNPLTNTLCSMLMYKIKSMESMFNDNIVVNMPLGNLSKTLVLANVVNLTVIKIIKSLRKTSVDFIVLDFSDMVKMEKSDFDELTSELNSSSDVKVIIIVCDIDPNYSQLNLRTIEIFAASIKNKSLMVITNNNNEVLQMVKRYFVEITEEIVDDHTYSLEDLKLDARDTVVKNAKIKFQGQIVSLKRLLNDKSQQNIIRGYAFYSIFFNKTIVIGETLVDKNYDDIGDLHMDRSLIRSGIEYEPHTFLDINDSIVLVTAGPGMGKSTLLTHLSVTTKTIYRHLWIIRINLLNYTAQMKKWKNEKAIIDFQQMICFMIHVIARKQINSLQIFIENTKNKVCLTNFTGCESLRFEIEIFLNCFNEGKVIFLFDGFDEIVPYFTETAVLLLNAVKMNCGHNRIWVTSRAYSKIQPILQENFGPPFELENFTRIDFSRYLREYWSLKLKTESQINSFLNRIPFDEKILQTASLSPVLGRVLVSLYQFIDEEIMYNMDYDSMKLRHFLCCRNKIYRLRESVHSSNAEASPMLTYLAANYLASDIKYSEESTGTSVFDVSTVYEWFIDKIVRRYFKYKKQVDLDNPFIMMDYEAALENFVEMHKKMAVYAMFQDEIHNIFDTDELNKIDVMITSIEEGKDKSELICGVSNNIPQFMHKTFAEYLSVEYLIELMKATSCHERRGALAIVINTQIDSLCVWINQKLQKETHKELAVYFPEIKNIIIPFPAL